MIEFSIFGPLIAGLNALRDFEKRPGEERRRFMQQHIDPVQERMARIHEDYTKSFSAAIAGLENRTSLQTVVQTLRAERPLRYAERADVRNFMNNLVRERLNQPPIKKDEPFTLFYDYVQAVGSYLSAASPLNPGDTWYSYFIQTFSRLVEQGEDPFLYGQYAIAGHEHDAPVQARVQLERAVYEVMPEAWNKLSDKYAALRARFLT